MNKKITDIFRQYRRMPVDETFVDSLRAHLLETMEADTHMNIARELTAERAALTPPMRRLVPALLILSLLFTSGGTVFASQKSLPGETLYPVKLLSENVRVAIALTAAKKAELQMANAAERTKEIEEVVTHRDNNTFTPSESRDIDRALENFTSNLEKAGKHADELRVEGNKKEAGRIVVGLSKDALIYRDILERSASSTEEEPVREHLRAVASSTELFQKETEQKFRDNEKDFEPDNGETMSTDKDGRNGTDDFGSPEKNSRRGSAIKTEKSSKESASMGNATERDEGAHTTPNQ